MPTILKNTLSFRINVLRAYFFKEFFRILKRDFCYSYMQSHYTQEAFFMEQKLNFGLIIRAVFMSKKQKTKHSIVLKRTM